MLKGSLVFIVFIFLAVIVCVEAEQLLISFYIFFPMLLLPVIFFLDFESRFLVPLALMVASAIYGIYLVRFFNPVMLFFGVMNAALFVFFLLYRKQWKTHLREQWQQCDTSLSELETLKQKHHSRLESLHHLEKQVAGLLDLFEIARDFNDCLSFESIAGILQQRVMPELTFQRLRLVLLDKVQPESVVQRVFSIADKNLKETQGTEDLTAQDLQHIDQVQVSKRLIRDQQALAFPILVDEEVLACLLVEGADPDDLAKFEVLSAYLALQVKKVRLYETVKELSIRDGLTGVFVRRHFLERLDEELKRSIKYNLSLAVLMLDIDHFKRYNDDYGHLAGDATLKQVAALLRENLRKVDIVARYGGEEFVVVIPEAQTAEALEVAERIRSNVARYNFKIYNDQSRVTVSIGIAMFPEDIPDWAAKSGPSELAAELIRHADQALYRAKDEGRNRVVLHRDL